MKLLDREFLADFFRAFFVLVLLLSIVHMVDTLLAYYSEMFGEVENGLYWGIVLMMCQLPGVLVDLTAVAVCAAILWVVTRKARQNEILAWLSGGVSPSRLSAPLIGAAALVAISAVAVTEWVVSPAERHARYVERIHFKGDDPATFFLSENIFQKGIGDRFYIIGAYDQGSATMQNAHVVEYDPETRSPRWTLEVASGSLESANPDVWLFKEAILAKYGPDGEVISHQQWDEVRDNDLEHPMEERLNAFLGQRRRTDLMSFMELWEYVSILRAQGKQTSEFVTRLHAKLALPLGACIVALVVCAHVMRPRSQGVLIGLGGGLLWVIGYYAMFFGFQNLAQAGLLGSAALSTWMPNIIYGVIGVVMMLRTGR
jgi:lipopolysaccharide export system permease protein